MRNDETVSSLVHSSFSYIYFLSQELNIKKLLKNTVFIGTSS